MGLAILGLLAVTALGVARRGSRAGDPLVRAVAMGVGAGVLGIGLHSMFEVTLFSELIVPLFALLGVLAAMVAHESRARAEAEAGVTAGSEPTA